MSVADARRAVAIGADSASHASTSAGREGGEASSVSCCASCETLAAHWQSS